MARVANRDPIRTCTPAHGGRSALSLELPTPRSNQLFGKPRAATTRMSVAILRGFERWLTPEIYCSRGASETAWLNDAASGNHQSESCLLECEPSS